MNHNVHFLASLAYNIQLRMCKESQLTIDQVNIDFIAIRDDRPDGTVNTTKLGNKTSLVRLFVLNSDNPYIADLGSAPFLQWTFNQVEFNGKTYTTFVFLLNKDGQVLEETIRNAVDWARFVFQP